MSVLGPSFERGQPAAPLRNTAMLGHDLRAALQGVLGGLAAIDGSRLDPATRDQLSRIAASAETVTGLLPALLGETAGSDAGPVRIRDLLDYLRRRWHGVALQGAVDLQLSAAPGAPTGISVDPVSLSRIVNNLIGNALRHGSARSVMLRVEPTPDGGVAFRLCDDGNGLEAEMLAQAQAPNWRPVGAAFPEHGLGLHIVRDLSEQLGGDIRFDNRAGGGFEAVLRFPADFCVETPAAAQPTEGGGADLVDSSDLADLSGLRILLAEDNPTNQMVAIQMLTALKAEVTIASDGVEALEHYETGTYDLVVVDIEMPRMSGLDVIRTIRARDDRRGRVPIVALTAYALREHQVRIAAAGANGLISKPISSIAALGRALSSFVQPARAPAVELVVESGPVVDLATYDALRQAIGADMMAELMGKVIVDLANAQGELAGALAPLDRVPIRSASHILISVAGAIGARRLETCAREVNHAAHGDDLAMIEAEVRRCLGELEAAIAFARGQLAVE